MFNVIVYNNADTVVYLQSFDTIGEAREELGRRGFKHVRTNPDGVEISHRPVSLDGTPGARGVIKEI